jgi:uncharacterized membrane protein
MSNDHEFRRSAPEPRVDKDLPGEAAPAVAASNALAADTLPPPVTPPLTPTLDQAATEPAPPVSAELSTALAATTPDGALDAEAVAAALTPLYDLDPEARERFAAEVPALYESLTAEQRRVLAETMVAQGRAFEAEYKASGGTDIEQDPEFQQIAAIQGAWADHTASLGVDPYGEDIDISISTTGEDYGPYLAEIEAFRDEQEAAGKHVWSDMWLPYTMWSRQGNLDRYRGTDNVTWVGENGLRAYNWSWRDQSFQNDSVAMEERDVAATVEQRGDGVIETEDGNLVQTHMGFNKLPPGQFPPPAWATVPQRPDEVVAEPTPYQLSMWNWNTRGEAIPTTSETTETVPRETVPPETVPPETVPTEAATQGSTTSAEIQNGALGIEHQNNGTNLEIGVDGNATASGYTPIGNSPVVAGGGVTFENGQLTATGQGGVRLPVGDDHLTALGYGSVTFGPDGAVESFGAGGSAELGEWGASVAVSFVDRDFATYVPAGEGTPAMVLYGQTNSESLSGGATVPVGPFVVGADGHVERSQTTQAFAAADTLTGLDPELARTDPKAYRDAVAALMGERTRDVDSPDDLDANVIATWGVGAGITIEQRVGEGGGGTFGLGPVSVEGGLDGSRIEQTTVTNLPDGGYQITVTSVDEEAWRAGVNAGPLGVSTRDSDTTSSSVTFTVDDPAVLQEYLETGVLPGAEAYAESVGLAEEGATRTDEEQAAAAADWNRAFLLAQQDAQTRGGPDVGDAEYTDLVFSEAFRQDTSLAVLGFDVLNAFHQEQNTEAMYTVDGAWETNFLYDQSESWMFSRDSHQSGISVNPESGAYLGMYASMDANADWIAEQGLTDLLDPNDPFTQLWASGAVWAEGTPRLELGVGIGEDQLHAIDAELEASGPADERFAALDENIDNRMLNFLVDNSDFEFEVDPATGELVVTNVPTEVALDNLAPYAGITPDEATAMFGDRADDPAFVVQSLVNVMNASPSDFADLDPLEQELYLRVGLNSYGTDPWFEQTEGNPFELLDLVADVEDPEIRDAMIRRTFYAAESQQEGAQGPLMFLQFADGLSPELRDRIREGAVVRVEGEVEPLNLLFDEFADGQASMRMGSASTVAMLEGMSPEQVTAFFDGVPELGHLDETRQQWEESHPGEPWPFDGVDPASMVFAMAGGNPAIQAQLLAATAGTPYFDQVTAYAAAHPEVFLGAAGATADPATTQFAIQHLAEVSGLDPLTLVDDPALVLGAMSTDPALLDRYVAQHAGDPAWQAQFAGTDGTALLAAYADDPAAYAHVLDALVAAGFDRATLTVGVLTTSGRYDATQAEGWVGTLDAAGAGDWMRDQEQTHGTFNNWEPGTPQMTAALVSVQSDPVAAAAFVDGYLAEAAADGHGGDEVSSMLSAFADHGGNAAQVQLAIDVLRASGRGDEVDAWLAAR